MGNAILMQGNEACFMGALKAGMNFFAGYPITPSTEILELASRELPKKGRAFIQMEDEISSIAAVLGASLAGAKAMTATSGPGFSLMQENIGYGCIGEIPCVIVNVMRGGPSTGLPTCTSQGDVMQARWGTHGDHPIIAFAPTNVEEIYHFTINAFNYAEKYRTPVILLLDETIAHMREGVCVDRNNIEVINRKKPSSNQKKGSLVGDEDLIPPMPAIGEGYKFHMTGLVHDEYGHPSNSPEVCFKLINRIHEKIERNIDDIVIYDYMDKKASNLILAYGSTARICKEIIDTVDANLFIPYTIWPFPEKELKECIIRNNVEKVYVPEMNFGQIYHKVKEVVGGLAEVISIPKFNGELFSPDEIENKIRGVEG